MKKAVILSGGRQYLVAEGDILTVNLLNSDKKTVSFEPVMIVEGKSSVVGTPTVKDIKVVADIVDSDLQGDKVIAIRYKAKKRVHTVRGHRQRETRLKIKSIS